MDLAGHRSLPIARRPVPPFGVPVIVSNCFWAGLYGAVFGLLMPRFTWPLWLCGLILGMIAALVGCSSWRRSRACRSPAAGARPNMLRSIVINGFWGLGVGMILPLLLPRALVSAHP